MIGSTREMPLEEALVDRHRLDRADRLVRNDFLDPIDQQHRIAMRERRHHPPDIQRADHGALLGTRLAHRPCVAFGLAAAGAAGCCGGVMLGVGNEASRR